MQSLSGMSSSQIVSASNLQHKSFASSALTLSQLPPSLHRDGAAFSDYAAQVKLRNLCTAGHHGLLSTCKAAIVLYTDHRGYNIVT